MVYLGQGSHQSVKSGKNLTIFSSQGNQEKQGFSGTIREKVCQSGNFFQPAKIVFANHVFFSLGRVGLSGFLLHVRGRPLMHLISHPGDAEKWVNG